MLDITALLLAAVVVAVSASIISRKWRWRQVEKLPGLVALPFIGTTYIAFLTKRENRMRKFDEVIKRFGPIFRSWIGPYPSIMIQKPEYLEKIMSSSELIEKSTFYSFLYPWLGEGLLTSSETAMGTSVNAQNETQSAYVNAIYSISELTIKRMIKPWLHTEFIFKRSSTGKEFYKQLNILHSFTKKVIRERKSARKTNVAQIQAPQEDDIGRKRRVAFLDMLLDASENGQKLNDQELQEEVDTFMFEGHDTTSVAMSWVLMLLGHHPGIQEKVFAELDDIFRTDPKRRPTTHDLNNMKYLEMVIKEALRLYPSVPAIGRRATKDIEIGSYKIPEGCLITLNIRHTHRDPDHWPDPERFNPDNFLPERVQGRHPFAYVPFSAGPRNCIGQKFAILEEKTVLSYVLRNFRVETVDRLEDLKLIGELVLRPMNGVNLRLWPR
ncbi:cytochrome P450 4C1-like isoform X7 [Schistocerca serialis cubense]|uniref:cytochrome P450 4C1-like isoform X7 n=1 Tax=Schistocerca serialis cubense TaxID=2023355 RepID=UPI00214F45FA|nr:cytochrome P450 4C1-like isoform X7 [Schistocerca serialis cubense]